MKGYLNQIPSNRTIFSMRVRRVSSRAVHRGAVVVAKVSRLSMTLCRGVCIIGRALNISIMPFDNLSCPEEGAHPIKSSSGAAVTM